MVTAASVERGDAPMAIQMTRSPAWRELYALLIEPVRTLLPRDAGSVLTIVPHGPLVNLSFAALRNSRGRYLVETFALHYAPAGAVLPFTALRHRSDARDGTMLLVADPVPPRSSSLDKPLRRLPGARSETRDIARLVSDGRALRLQDAAATEVHVRESAPTRAVLHFATHAIVRSDDPFASYLVLAPSGPGAPVDANADGILTAQDVYGLTLHADLVVLSACQSAAGTVAGDAIATFARAFFAAGTASVLASVWDVADEPTNRLMPAFYRSWLSGTGKARALRLAQIRLIADLRAGRVRIDTPAGMVALPEHPVFWAGFALIGEPD